MCIPVHSLVFRQAVDHFGKRGSWGLRLAAAAAAGGGGGGGGGGSGGGVVVIALVSLVVISYY